MKAETLFYTALIGYIHYEAPVEEQNFATLIEFINASEVREDDEEFKNPVDLMFEALEKEKPRQRRILGVAGLPILLNHYFNASRLILFAISVRRQVPSLRQQMKPWAG